MQGRGIPVEGALNNLARLKLVPGVGEKLVSLGLVSGDGLDN